MAPEPACPWLWASLVFLVLIGTGRGLVGILGVRHGPCGTGFAISAALGLLLFSWIWLGLGHGGYLGRTPAVGVLGVGALLALPGL